jgi:hypothetical protein
LCPNFPRSLFPSVSKNTARLKIFDVIIKTERKEESRKYMKMRSVEKTEEKKQ